VSAVFSLERFLFFLHNFYSVLFDLETGILVSGAAFIIFVFWFCCCVKGSNHMCWRRVSAVELQVKILEVCWLVSVALKCDYCICYSISTIQKYFKEWVVRQKWIIFSEVYKKFIATVLKLLCLFCNGLFYKTIIFATGTQGFHGTPFWKHWFWFLRTRTVYNFIVEEHSSGATMEKEVGDETRFNLRYAKRNCLVCII